MMEGLNPLFSIVFVLIVAFAFLLTGYAMGRCSAGYTLGRTEEKPKKFDPGPGAEVDFWQEQMEPIEEEGKRTPTI